MAVFKEDLVAGLKAGMRRLASGVCVISLKDKNGQAHAMTATSVTSLSDNPPALLVCVNKNASPYPALMDHQPFCVSVLAEGHDDISAHCASKTEQSRFSKGDWQQHNDGLPFLSDGEANFFCVTEQLVEYGTHIIVIGRLSEVITADSEVRPLLYADGQYRTLK